jgi:sigma-E factor negative regulatory protein RseB
MRVLERRRGARWIPAVAFLGVACAAQANPGNDPLAWLKRAAEAARSATYAGTFVHTNGDRTSTVRVTHVTSGSDEHERIEPLDGPALEIVRRNEEMFCRFPDAKTVRLDRRITAPFFPAVLRSPPDAIAASYDVKLGKSSASSGHECRWIRLDPKDQLRFAQRLCSEQATGLVLRAKTVNDQRQVIEQYTFTELKLGAQVAKAPRCARASRPGRSSGRRTSSRARKPGAWTPDGRSAIPPRDSRRSPRSSAPCRGAASRFRRSC